MIKFSTVNVIQFLPPDYRNLTKCRLYMSHLCFSIFAYLPYLLTLENISLMFVSIVPRTMAAMCV